MNSTDASTDKQRLIVVGNGMVGHHCVEQLLAGGALAHYRIEVFGEEAQRAYDRVHLSEYFGGRDAESLAMSAASLYEEEGLTLHLGCPVLGIDREAREVVTALGRFGYDMESIKSRPLPHVQFEYYFYVQLVCPANAATDDCAKLVHELENVCRTVRILGVFDL